MQDISPYLPLIARSALFANVDASSVSAMLGCLDARIASYEKGETIFRAGDTSRVMGLVLEGGARIEREDYWGNRSILGTFGPGQTFGEAFACQPGQPFDVNVIAPAPATILLLDVQRVVTMCSSNCVFHAQLIRNLLNIVAKRTHALTRKIEHISKRTTRAKLLSYLSDQAAAHGSRRFSIPFDRQELADYLSVDRSAMSAELSRMKRDGILDYHKNSFELKRKDPA